jgi:hypothetical protein
VPDYDFHTLSPLDFEELSRDLIQVRDKVVLETFKVGRDRGVDFRLAEAGETLVVQCKHLRKSGFTVLLREVKKEAVKIAGMRPQLRRYILSTSVELNPDNKDALAAALGGFDPNDILGSNDLNNLLGLHPKIEHAHFKLWLTSVPVMVAVLHNAERVQSDFEFRRVEKTIPRFVQTRAYAQSVTQLQADRVLILSGAPGVGKSTLAEFLLYEHLAKGFEPIIARNGLDEARKLYRPNTQQIFYYDDFLGATYLGEGGSALVRNEDRAISDFIAMVVEDPTKMLILTTREHLLSQALDGSERLRHSRLAEFRYVVALRAYSEEQRARILYNHIYFSDMPSGYRHALLNDDFFWTIIRHDKVSPRLIEWLTSYHRVKANPPADYPAFVRRLLDNPAEVWRHAYDREISDAARSLLLTVLSFDGRVGRDRLQAAFDELHQERARRYGFRMAPSDYTSALRGLADAFITIGDRFIEFFDPSVRDLMNTVVRSVPANGIDIIRGASSMSQVQVVWRLAKAAEGGALLASVQTKADDLQLGLSRAMQAATIVKVDGGFGLYAPLLEERLATLIELVEGTGSNALARLIQPAVHHMLAQWEDVRPEYETTVRVLLALGASKVLQPHDLSTLWSAIRSALLSRVGERLDPSEVIQLLRLDEGTPLSDDDQEGLRDAASRWRRDMGDLLRDTRSSDELERLKEQLAEVAATLDFDLSDCIRKVETELEMYVEAEEAQADAHLDSWKEDYRFEREARRSISDMFKTLRDQDE